MKMQKLKQKKHFELIRLIEYGISGGAYFWTGYIVFFVAYTGLHWTLWWAKLSANVIGWIINYLLQRYWVFNNTKLSQNKLQVTGRYILITAVDFVMDYYIVWFLKTKGLTPYLGQFVSAGFFTAWNYVWYRFYVFPDHYPHKKSKTHGL